MFTLKVLSQCMFHTDDDNLCVWVFNKCFFNTSNIVKNVYIFYECILLTECFS